MGPITTCISFRAKEIRLAGDESSDRNPSNSRTALTFEQSRTMRTSAEQIANSVLDADIARLEDLGYDLEILSEQPHVGIVVRDVELPAGYSKSTTSVLLLTTDLYPM